MAKKLKIYNGSSWEDVTFAITPPTTSVTNSFTTNQVIDASTSVAALRITQRGTGEALRVEDETNTDSTPFVIDASGNVGIGNTSSIPLQITSSAVISAGLPSVVIQGNNNTERIAIRSVQPVAVLQGFRGTIASPTAIQSGDPTGYYQLGGYDGTQFVRGAWITGVATENWSSTNRGSSLSFSTTPNGSTTIAERIRIDQDGQVNLPNNKLIINSTLSVTGANWAESMLHITGDSTAANNPSVSWHAPGASAMAMWHPRGGQALQIMGNSGVVSTGSGTMTIRNIAISTSNPSGGADGDMWAVYV